MGACTKRSGIRKKYHLIAFLEDECEKLETIPDGDDVKKKWVAEMVTLLETKLTEAKDTLSSRPIRKSKRGALEEEPSIDEDQPSHQKAARTERVTDVIKGAIEADVAQGCVEQRPQLRRSRQSPSQRSNERTLERRH